MLTYTVYSEGGGVVKSSLTASLAVAHARAGLNVLLPSRWIHRTETSADCSVSTTIVPTATQTTSFDTWSTREGPFEDLIRTAEVSISFPDNMLSDLASHLDRGSRKPRISAMRTTSTPAARPPGGRRRRSLRCRDCDPPAMESPPLQRYLRDAQVRHPVEPSSKGDASVTGLENSRRTSPTR